MNVIRGGTIASAIPDFCELEVDRRFLPGGSVADILADYRQRLDAQSARIAAFPGGADAPNLGFPCVVRGPGHLEQAHGRDEFVDLSQMEHASEICLRALIDLNGIGT